MPALIEMFLPLREELAGPAYPTPEAINKYIDWYKNPKLSEVLFHYSEEVDKHIENTEHPRHKEITNLSNQLDKLCDPELERGSSKESYLFFELGRITQRLEMPSSQYLNEQSRELLQLKINELSRSKGLDLINQARDITREMIKLLAKTAWDERTDDIRVGDIVKIVSSRLEPSFSHYYQQQDKNNELLQATQHYIANISDNTIRTHAKEVLPEAASKRGAKKKK